MPYRRRTLISIIAECRRDQGVGQRELSRRMKKPYMWVSRLERGEAKHIDVFDLMDVADQLHANASDWLRALEKKKPRHLRSPPANAGLAHKRHP